MGLYRKSEKREWWQLQAMPTYKEALINEVERGTCSSMQFCPYAEGRMATAAGGFDLGSLVPELPSAGLINQLLNRWNWVNLASMVITFWRLEVPMSMSRYRTFPSSKAPRHPPLSSYQAHCPEAGPPSPRLRRQPRSPLHQPSLARPLPPGISHFWISSTPSTMHPPPDSNCTLPVRPVPQPSAS